MVVSSCFFIPEKKEQQSKHPRKAYGKILYQTPSVVLGECHIAGVDFVIDCSLSIKRIILEYVIDFGVGPAAELRAHDIEEILSSCRKKNQT